MTHRQNLLPFPSATATTNRENLVLGPGNGLAWEAIRQLLGTKSGTLILHGEEGTGKTHLLRAAIQDAPAARYLDLGQIRHQLGDGREEGLSLFLKQQENLDLVAVDHLEQLQGESALQEGVLFLVNQLRGRGRFLAAGRLSPAAMPWMRTDLSSRLLWGPVVSVEQPEEGQLAAIFAKLARDRQVFLPPDLTEFLLRRLPRRVTAFAQALSQLDEAGLRGRRTLSIPLAKEILGL